MTDNTDIRSETPPPGVYPGIPFECYRQWEAFNITTGLQLEKSIGHYFYALGKPWDDTASMRLGRIFECFLLEPDKFEEQYVVSPVEDRRTKEYKNLALQAQSEAKELITAPEYIRITDMAEAVMARDCAGQLVMEKGDVQVSIAWEEQGRLCKGRTDKIICSANSLIDLKTTIDASPESFTKTVIKYGYHVQLAHYAAGLRANGIQIDHCIILAVENEAPFGVIPYRLTEQTMKIGEERRQKLFTILKTAEANQDELAYPDCIQELALAI